jgi:hypothetical protein
MKRIGFTLSEFCIAICILFLATLMIAAVSNSTTRRTEQGSNDIKPSSGSERIGNSAYSSGVTVHTVTIDGHKLAVAVGSQCVSIIELKDDHAAKAEDK